MRSALETFAAANSVGGQLYLAQDHQKYLVRYAGTPRFIDNRAIVPVYARPAQGGPEQLTTLVVEFDELDYTVSEWELKRAQGWWQQNRVTYL